jgi:hypothetical protein
MKPGKEMMEEGGIHSVDIFWVLCTCTVFGCLGYNKERGTTVCGRFPVSLGTQTEDCHHITKPHDNMWEHTLLLGFQDTLALIVNSWYHMLPFPEVLGQWLCPFCPTIASSGLSLWCLRALLHWLDLGPMARSLHWWC